MLTTSQDGMAASSTVVTRRYPLALTARRAAPWEGTTHTIGILDVLSRFSTSQ